MCGTECGERHGAPPACAKKILLKKIERVVVSALELLATL
jgi:pyrimidine deaminase RibD-like protein